MVRRVIRKTCLKWTIGVWSIGTIVFSFATISSIRRDALELRFDFQNYTVDDSCKAIPFIVPSHDNKNLLMKDDGSGPILPGSSPKHVVPSFQVGSHIGEHISSHMEDAAFEHFEVVKQVLKGKEGGLVFDIGANHGFYTYYLATLGMNVHAFEINKTIFRALEHGLKFNPKHVADRVHLYSIGLGDTNARFRVKGKNFEGYLSESSTIDNDDYGIRADN